MPRQRKNPGEKIDCSKRSTTPFQTYVGNLILKKPDKIKSLLARALMNEDYLNDFNGQIHANECVFSYPNSNWYGVYLIDQSGKKYFGENGAQKFYFQLELQTNNEGIPIDANPVNGTFETPDELMVNGEEIKTCIIKESGRCGNPESKRKTKKKTITPEDYEEESESETPEDVLKKLTTVPLAGVAGKSKMPRDYFESLGSKSLIIDWMIANMKPGEIFKCIQRGSLSAEDVKQAQQILGETPLSTTDSTMGGSSSGGVAEMVQSFSPSQINGMIKSVTKEELYNTVNRIKDPDRKKQSIITMCKRAGIKKYKLKVKPNGKGTIIVDADGDQVDDIHEVLNECAEKEAYRIKKLLKLQSISHAIKKMSKEDLMNYQGGNVPLPYSLMTYVKRFFPLIKKYENRNGLLYASIPSVREDDELYYFKVDDVLGKDLRKLDSKIHEGTVSFGKRRFGNRTMFGKRKINIRVLRKDLKRVIKK